MAEAVEIISESIIKNVLSYSGEDCDLAVAVNPNDLTLQTAWSALKPGGCIYIEWIVSPFCTTRSIQNKLRNIGFQAITCYMPKPDPSTTPSHVWIPLGYKGVIDYYIRDICNPESGGLFEKLCKELRHVLWTLSPTLFTTFPWLISSGERNIKVCTVASKPIINGVIETTSNHIEYTDTEGKEVGKSPDTISNIITGCLNRAVLSNNSKKISMLMLTSRGGNEKVLIFVFVGLDMKPTIVIKIPRTNIPSLLLQNEALILKTLQEKFKTIEGVPKVLYVDYGSESAIVGETFISGVQLSNNLNKRNYRELSVKATAWLTDLAQQTKSSSPVDSKAKSKDDIIACFIESYRSELYPVHVKQINDILNSLDIKFRTFSHMDLGPWNILIKPDGGLGIIDWESGQLYGVPFSDLMTLLTCMTFQLENTYQSLKYRQTYLKMLDPSTFTGSVFKECSEYYAHKLDIPQCEIPAYRLLTWLINAELECSALRDIKDKVEVLASARKKNIYILLVKEELEHSLRSKRLYSASSSN